MKFINKFLNGITMYKLLFYGLFVVFGYAMLVSLLADSFAYEPLDMALSLGVILLSAISGSLAFSRFFGATYNAESAGISGLIIFFIFTPANELNDYLALVGVSLVVVATKFLIAPGKRHLLNPVAAGAVITGIIGFASASWWAASIDLLIPMAVFGFLVLKKLHRISMFVSFYIASVVSIFFFAQNGNGELTTLLSDSVTVWPVLFLGTIMLTEPITTPPKRALQLAYGALVGLLLGSAIQINDFFMTPEWALVIANVAFFWAFLQKRVTLKLNKQTEVADTIHEFSFTPEPSFSYTPGEYLEITAPLDKSDSRGNRRSFSIASAPSEKDIKLGIKLMDEPSAFKKYMSEMKPGDELYANHRQGDFTLKKDAKKLVFIAGGIGITPFRSIVADIALKKKEGCEVVLFYQVADPAQLAYKNIFDAKKTKEMGVTTVYVSTAKEQSDDWEGETGFINAEMIQKYAPDYLERTFYLSGPNAMVQAYNGMLRKSGVSRWRIKRDYFSGY